MKNVIKIVLILLVTIVLVTGCVETQTKTQNQTKTQTQNQSDRIVKVGDKVTIDYIVYLDGTIYNTNIEKVAKENNISYNNLSVPISFKVGKEKAIKGIEEGVIGMKLGESKNITVPPDKGFEIDPKLIRVMPRIEKIRTTRNISKIFDIPADVFLDENIKIGDVVQVPGTTVNATIKNMSSSSISLQYNLNVGNIVSFAPFKEQVINIDDKNITLKPDVKKGETINWSVWNTTIINIDDNNMTLEHNSIPDTKIEIAYRTARIHFNDTSIIMDFNDEMAGKTLIYTVTIKGINGINS